MFRNATERSIQVALPCHGVDSSFKVCCAEVTEEKALRDILWIPFADYLER